MVTNNEALPVPWRPGEHVAVAGRNGTGKTFLISQLVQERQYCAILRTKPDDIVFPDFKTARTATALDNINYNRVLITPKYERQALEGARLLDKVWRQGGWTVVIDELWYVEKLGLKPYVERLLTQGRSKKISVVVGMQRPAQVSRFSISECTHFFIFQVEGRDLKPTLTDSTTQAIYDPVRRLDRHDFCYFNTRNRIIAIGNARQLRAVIKSPKSNTI